MDHVAAEYGEQSYNLQEMLVSGKKHLATLGVGDEVSEEFDAVHGDVELLPPKSATPEDLSDLNERVAALREVVERLSVRTESDGIFCSIYYLALQKGWPIDARYLVRRILESSADVVQFATQRQQSYKALGAATTPIKYKQLTEWLEANDVTYTDEAMSYLLQSVGRSVAAIGDGETIAHERFVDSMREHLKDAEVVVKSFRI